MHDGQDTFRLGCDEIKLRNFYKYSVSIFHKISFLDGNSTLEKSQVSQQQTWFDEKFDFYPLF